MNTTNMIIGNEILAPFIISLLISSTIGIVSLIANKNFNERNYEVKYVTEERQKWRKDIKEKTSLFCSICSMVYVSTEEEKEIRKLKTFIALSLNPEKYEEITEDEKIKEITEDEKIKEMTEDEKIVYYLNNILIYAINYKDKDKDKKEKYIKELEILVAFLLKDDWESLKEDMGISYRKVNRKKRSLGKRIPKRTFL